MFYFYTLFCKLSSTPSYRSWVLLFAVLKAFVSSHYRFDRASNVEEWVSVTSELDYPCKVYSSQVITSITVRYQCRILHATQTVETVLTCLNCFVRLWENSKFVSRQLEKIGIYHNTCFEFTNGDWSTFRVLFLTVEDKELYYTFCFRAYVIDYDGQRWFNNFQENRGDES